MNPFVFIVGCPRSGTTLLQRLLDCHPQVAVTPETHWIPRWYEKNGAKGITPEDSGRPGRVPISVELAASQICVTPARACCCWRTFPLRW
jgi:hypothetical protein